MIPGVIISLLTFPGVIVHELGHLLVCRMLGIEVQKVRYFRLGNPAGYVLHDAASGPLQQILVGFGPFFANTTLGFAVGLAAALVISMRASLPLWLVIGVPWLSVSIGMHAFPSTGDASTIWDSIWARGVSWYLRLVGIPFVILIYIGAIGSALWLDVIYGGALLGLAIYVYPRLG